MNNPTPNGRPSEAAMKAAAWHLALARRDLMERTPRESAEAAHWSGGPPIDELERRIRERLGMPPTP